MNLQLIRQRSLCCRQIGELGLDERLTEAFDAGRLAGCLSYLSGEKAAAQISALELKLQVKLFQSRELLRYVVGLLACGASVLRLSSLLQQADSEKILQHDQADVLRVLGDHGVPREFIFAYLECYARESLHEEERQRLWIGLRNFYERQTRLREDWLKTHGDILYEDIMASDFLTGISHLDVCLEHLAESHAYHELLAYIKGHVPLYVRLDDENEQELYQEAGEIARLLAQAERYFDADQFRQYCALWLGNHALLYDLRCLKKKLEREPDLNVQVFLQGRASYIAFCYNEHFSDQMDEEREDQVVYAITHKKHAFLRLIRENMEAYRRIPTKTLFFQKPFYKECINLNTLNAKNLRDCAGMKQWNKESVAVLAEKERTFEEVLLFCQMPPKYVLLYDRLDLERRDERLCVMREVVKKRCLHAQAILEPVAERLSQKRLSAWMQQDFRDIKGLDAGTAMRLLEKFRQLKHLVPGIRTVAEARYLLDDADGIASAATMQEVRSDVLLHDKEWLCIAEAFGFTDEFIGRNEERIREFVFEDGAHIAYTYLQGNPSKKEELRRLVSAELMGRFRELKYHEDDLSMELDYPISEAQKQAWMKNGAERDGSMEVKEEDGFLPVMRMGEIPYATCLSYKGGGYSQCLIAGHDANKKILNLSMDGKIVLRAAIRLTKGSYDANKKEPGQPSLEFTDLLNAEPAVPKQDRGIEELVLFLERPYIHGLPERMQSQAFRLMLRLLRRKAGEMGAKVVISINYNPWASENISVSNYSLYISRSKAGEQYLDSLGGSNHVNREGSYYWGRFLFLCQTGKAKNC